jgi:hypothetical protein
MPTKFLQADLALASQNQIGKKADQSFMFGCLMLDPATGKIRFAIEGVLRILMGLTAIGLALFIYSMVRQERKANTVSGLTGT